jgi:hypothetical protein
MSSIRKIQRRRQQILEELSHLTEVRRGNLTEQMVETVGADRRCRFLGPCPLSSFKVKGKTLSRRVTDPAQVALYSRQIQCGRRFQERPHVF